MVKTISLYYKQSRSLEKTKHKYMCRDLWKWVGTYIYMLIAFKGLNVRCVWAVKGVLDEQLFLPEENKDGMLMTRT